MEFYNLPSYIFFKQQSLSVSSIKQIKKFLKEYPVNISFMLKYRVIIKCTKNMFLYLNYPDFFRSAPNKIIPTRYDVEFLNFSSWIAFFANNFLLNYYHRLFGSISLITHFYWIKGLISTLIQELS